MENLAKQILEYQCIYWIIAFAMSTFWGYFGVKYEELIELEVEQTKDDEEKNSSKITKYVIDDNKHEYECWYKVGTFVSDGLFSLVGWICLYFLLTNMAEDKLKAYENFNIFLGTVAIICITGYGYKIAEKLKVK